MIHNDGDINVESPPGANGFSVSLPIADAERRSEGVNKPVILVVDDDAQVLAAVRRDLRSRYREHYTIVSAASGEEALGDGPGVEGARRFAGDDPQRSAHARHARARSCWHKRARSTRSRAASC